MADAECPRHGLGGSEADNVVEASIIRFGFSSVARPRQIWRCRYLLKDGAVGHHKFMGGTVPRLVASDPTCRDCGQPLEKWRGAEVFENYWFPFKPVATALSQLANGVSYRQAASDMRRVTGRQADAQERRRMGTLNLIHALNATGEPGDADMARQIQHGHPFHLHSREAPLAEWLVQTFSPILHAALAPQDWPEGGIVAVDSVKMNLLGKHKYLTDDGNAPDHQGEAGSAANESFLEVTVPDIETSQPDMVDLLDPDDPEEADLKQLLCDLQPDGTHGRSGLQGGVPCWEVLGAYGYARDPDRGFPRDQEAGRLWLLRSYYKPDGRDWAHFFRQLPGMPGYVICDMAPQIRVGVELAWPDETKRPQVLVCEHHVIEAVRRRVAGDERLEEEAGRLFLTQGRLREGVYQPYVSNGSPGSLRRLWHFMWLRRLARQAEILNPGGAFQFDEMFAKPTWRRIMEQVVEKDGSLRYSTGALESVLFQLASSKLSWRRGWMKNRIRTDRLLDLMQLQHLGVANPDTISRVIEHHLRHNPMPRQDRRTDPTHQGASLRQPLPDSEYAGVGLPIGAEFDAWIAARRSRLADASFRDRYHRDPTFRAAHLARTRRWHAAHSTEEVRKALVRHARAKAKDPDRFHAQRREQSQRHRDRERKVAAVVAAHNCTEEQARSWLKAVEWNLDAVQPRFGESVESVVLLPPDTGGRGHGD